MDDEGREKTEAAACWERVWSKESPFTRAFAALCRCGGFFVWWELHKRINKLSFQEWTFLSAARTMEQARKTTSCAWRKLADAWWKMWWGNQRVEAGDSSGWGMRSKVRRHDKIVALRQAQGDRPCVGLEPGGGKLPAGRNSYFFYQKWLWVLAGLMRRRNEECLITWCGGQSGGKKARERQCELVWVTRPEKSLQFNWLILLLIYSSFLVLNWVYKCILFLIIIFP